jgi:hypothetical protein
MGSVMCCGYTGQGDGLEIERELFMLVMYSRTRNLSSTLVALKVANMLHESQYKISADIQYLGCPFSEIFISIANSYISHLVCIVIIQRRL